MKFYIYISKSSQSKQENLLILTVDSVCQDLERRTLRLIQGMVRIHTSSTGSGHELQASKVSFTVFSITTKWDLNAITKRVRKVKVRDTKFKYHVLSLMLLLTISERDKEDI